MRKPVLLICGLAMAAPLMAQDQGLHATADDLSSPRWQARFERIASPLDGRVATPLWLLGQSARTLQLFGDYQFSSLRLGQTGGLRITGGVLLNLRPAGLAGTPADAASGQLLSGSGYAGVGYASGGARGDWGFSADLGLTGLNFGQSAAHGAASGWGLRDLRLQPMLRLGMNMAF